MPKFLMAILVAAVISNSAVAQRSSPATEDELSQISDRGKRLSEYDVAATHATDAMRAINPKDGSVAGYIAQKSDGRWRVMFGRLNETGDKYLIAYEATQGAKVDEFDVTTHDPPIEDSQFWYRAAKAIDLVQKDFRGEDRPYNVAVLPAPSEQLFVYVFPAQTQTGIFPLGGDARYLVSGEGSEVIEKRELHRSIIDFDTSEHNGDIEFGYHMAVVDDVPEDTDVAFVLHRKPSIPQFVVTKQFVYRIETDGSIKYIGKTDDFEKSNDN